MPKFDHNLLTAWGVGRVGEPGERRPNLYLKLSESNIQYERTPLLGPDAVQRQRVIRT